MDNERIPHMHFDFLLCSERSGSNLITRILGSHSQVSAPSTTHAFRLLCQNEPRYGDLTNEHNWLTLLRDTVDLLRATLGDWTTHWTVDRLYSSVRSRTLGDILRTIYVAEAVANNKQRSFVKEIEVFDFFPFLQKHFPDASYVHLVRDPRDMAVSWKKSAAIRGGVVRAAKTWIRDQRAYQQLEPRNEGPRGAICSRMHTTTYEQLVADPTTHVSAICKFLDLSFEPTQLNFYERADANDIANSAIDFLNLKQPIMRSNFGQFRKELSDLEIAYVESLCGGEMRRYGYLPESDSCRHSVRDLEARLLPHEPHVKSAYATASRRERQIRSQWMAVAERIRSRSHGLG
jgi:hypothetical protein